MRATLGILNAGELDAALALSQREGWNQTAADWSRLIQLEPAGCFAAHDGTRLIGTVTTTTYGRALAWIGMMVIDPDFRRQGIGVALMRLAIEYLHGAGIATIKLDATPAGRPLYESLGFIAEAEFERWQGTAAHNTDLPRNDSSPDVLFALDRDAYGLDRSALLELLIADGAGTPMVAMSAHGQPVGYALARRGRITGYIGPLIATKPEVAGQLLDGMLARFAGTEVGLDLHRGGLLDPAWLAAQGLSRRRSLIRMYHGPRSAAGTAPLICASAGPEFG